jgi:phage shock protein C
MKKDMKNKMLFGVCSGLAQEFQTDVVIIRAAFAIAAIMGFGIPIVVYIVLAMVMPEN